MYVNLYSTTDDPRKVNKALSLVAANIPCKPAEPCALISPRVLLDFSSTYFAANYVYISAFDCYYFCEPILQTGRELRLECKLDPLMSFTLDDIEIMCIRSESAGVNYIPDSKLPVDPSRCTLDGQLFRVQPFVPATASEGARYLLTINGGEFL